MPPLMWNVASRLLKFGAALVAAVGLAACGGAASSKSVSTIAGSTTDPPTVVADPDPGRVVARVGDSAITAATVDHWLTVEERRKHLVPPRFTECIASLGAATTAAKLARPSQAQLLSSCKELDQQLLDTALERYIVGDWVIGAARELGVDVTGQTFEREFASALKTSFHTQAALHSYMARLGGVTLADERFQVHDALDQNAIRAAIKRSVGAITANRVREYYDQHKSQYFYPETRDLEIAGTTTRAAAVAIRNKIASGQSFASVVKTLSSPQPVKANEQGLVVGLPPGYYKEPSLNHAIFTAKPGVLSGPIKTEIGYYVFKVKSTSHAVQLSLGAVAALIKAILPEALARQALVDYIKAWRAKWTARTDCTRGYVIRKCRQFKVPVTAGPEDPYILN